MLESEQARAERRKGTYRSTIHLRWCSRQLARQQCCCYSCSAPQSLWGGHQTFWSEADLERVETAQSHHTPGQDRAKSWSLIVSFLALRIHPAGFERGALQIPRFVHELRMRR